MTGSSPRVVVVGAGIVGSWTAYELARAGCDVRVVDAAAEGVSPSASFGNAGILALSYAKPMSNPRTLLAGIRSILGRGHAVEIATPLRAATLRWMLHFGIESRPGRASRAAGPIYAAARRSLQMYDELATSEGIDLRLRRTGWLHVAHTRAALRHHERLAVELAQLGIRSSVIDVDGLQELEPSLNRSLVGGVLFPDDVSMDPALVTSAVREAARRQGADFIKGHVVSARVRGKGVSALLTDAGDGLTGDQYVIAAGADSASVGHLIGTRLAVEPGVGWSLTIPTEEPLAGRALAGIEDHVVVNPGPDSVRITGGMRFGASGGTAPAAEKLAALRAAATRLLPPLAGLSSRGQGWEGARPMTASGSPIVRRASGTTIIATGHGTLGMTLAPHTGEQVRRLILGRSMSP